MKMRAAVIGLFLAGCLLATGCVQHHHHAQPVVVDPTTTVGGPVGADPDVDMFYNDLAPYGEWVYVDGPGWVWSPYGVDADWRPYSYGHWVYTDYGWTWASDEEWGWAAYHYGRWHQAPRYGWVWVPGSEWGPAWVAWHEGDDWVGWAPLPYQVRWQAGIGLDWGHGSVQVSIQTGHWSFVATRHLVEPHVHRHIAPRARNTTYIRVTNHVTNYTYIDNRVVNRSVQVKRVSKAIGHPVRQHRVRHADSPGRARGGRDDGDDLVIYRPREHRGRAPQRRPVPPGHDDERQGKNDRQGRNDRDERPAAHRPHRGSEPDESSANRPSTRPRRHGREADGQKPPATGRGPQKRTTIDDGRSDRMPPDRGRDDHSRRTRPAHPDARDPRATAPPDRSHGGDSGDRPQAAPRPTREPQRSTTPASPTGKPGIGKSAPGKSVTGKAKQSDAKPEASDSGKPGAKKSKSSKGKGKTSKGDDEKGGKSKQQEDPETKEQDSAKKGSKKRH